MCSEGMMVWMLWCSDVFMKQKRAVCSFNSWALCVEQLLLNIHEGMSASWLAGTTSQSQSLHNSPPLQFMNIHINGQSRCVCENKTRLFSCTGLLHVMWIQPVSFVTLCLKLLHSHKYFSWGKKLSHDQFIIIFIDPLSGQQRKPLIIVNTETNVTVNTVVSWYQSSDTRHMKSDDALRLTSIELIIQINNKWDEINDWRWSYCDSLTVK